MVRASDFGPRGPWFEPRPVHFVVALSKSHLPSLVLVEPRKRWTDDRLGQTVTRLEITLCLKAWSHRRTDMYRRENGLKYAEFGYPVTQFISSAAQSSRDRHVEPGS